jgi:hypothetical protein
VALSLIGLVVLGAGAWAAFGRAPDVPQTTPARLDVTRSVETEARPVIPIVAAPADPDAAVAKAQEFGCLSVNALPFAQIYVDGQPMGYTPKACLRMAVGEHRVRFVTNGQRSPERLVRITARHKPAAPLRLSYDFDTGQFIEK